MQAVDAAGEILQGARVELGRRRRPAQGLIHALGELFEPTFDRRQRGGRYRTFDLGARVGDQRGEPGRFDLWRGIGGKTVDAVGEVADLALKPFDRHRTRGGGGEQIAHFLGLGADALEGGGIDDALGDRVDLGAERAQLALETGDRDMRIVRAQGVARFGDQRGQRLARAVVAQRGDALAEIAHRAFERDDRVARREIDQAARHRGEFAAQGLNVGRGGSRLLGLFATNPFEPRAKRGDFLAQGFDAGGRCGFGGGRARTRRRLGAGGARVEFATSSGDLRRRLLRVEARTVSGFGRLAPPLRFTLDATGERVEARVEIARARLQRPLDPLFDRRQALGRRLQRFGALGAAFQPGHRRFKQVVVGARIARARRFARPARFEPRSGAAFVFVAVVAARQPGDSFADRVEPVVAPEIGGFDPAFGGALGDDLVEPVAEAKAGPARGLLGENARLAPYARDLPGCRAVHRLARGRPLGNRCAAGP